MTYPRDENSASSSAAESRPSEIPSEAYSEEALIHFSHPDEYAAFKKTAGKTIRPRFARALDLIDPEHGRSFLDLGCGRGEVVFKAASAGAYAVGLDYSRGSLSLAAATIGILPPEMRPRVALLQGEATSLPFADGAFDRIGMLDIVEHLHPWQLDAALSEIRRVLRVGGYLVIHTLPNVWALKYAYRAARLLKPSLPASPRRPCELEVHVNEQSIFTLQAALERTGFQSRIWLEGLSKEQAVFQQGGKRLMDVRRPINALLASPYWGRFYDLLMKTPLRLLLANDIYALAWHPEESLPELLKKQGPHAWLERILLLLRRTARVCKLIYQRLKGRFMPDEALPRS